MSRPLMQHGVGQLEEMFAKARADPKLLKQLEHELQYRQVPRATVLLAEAAMYGGAPTPPPSCSAHSSAGKGARFGAGATRPMGAAIVGASRRDARRCTASINGARC
jgi:hypothetical protein